MDEKLMDEICNSFLFKHRDMYFHANYTTPEVIDALQHMVIRDDDVFLVTYPKSGIFN